MNGVGVQGFSPLVTAK